MVQVPTAGGGLPDVYIEGAAARFVREPVSNIEKPPAMPGYEAGGEPIGEGEDTDA